jgi:hypothetical protein
MLGLGTKTAPSRTLKSVAPLVPYLAVIVGLYGMSSGWASILLYHGGMVLLLSIARGWVAPSMARTARCVRLMAAVLAASALVGPVLFVIWPTMALADFELADELGRLGLVDHWWVLFMVYYATVNPALEEIYWRGYLGSCSKGITRNDFFFAGYHVLVISRFVGAPWVAAGFLGLVGAAWFWRRTSRKCGGLAIPVASHAVADASLILAGYLLAA